MYRRKTSSILLTPVILSAGLLAGCSEKTAVQAEPIIRPAKLIEVTLGSNEKQVSFPAIIEASSSSELTFEVGGTITDLLVKQGQEVQQNDVVARLDQRTYQSEVTAAQAQYDNAQAEYSRAKRLLKEKAIARNVFEQRRSQRNVARTTLDRALEALENTELRAPFAGVVAIVETEQFQNVSPGNPILLLQSTGAAEAVVQIPATLIANSGRIEPLETSVVLDAAPLESIPAVFLSASAKADESTQTFQVKFSFTPTDSIVVLPGMTGTIKGRYRTLDDPAGTQPAVPLAAIGSDGDERFAWVVDTSTMTVTRRAVVVGSGIGEYIKVLDGLAAGETIVGAGMSYLQEGMQIRAYEP